MFLTPVAHDADNAAVVQHLIAVHLVGVHVHVDPVEDLDAVLRAQVKAVEVGAVLVVEIVVPAAGADKVIGVGRALLGRAKAALLSVNEMQLDPVIAPEADAETAVLQLENGVDVLGALHRVGDAAVGREGDQLLLTDGQEIALVIQLGRKEGEIHILILVIQLRGAEFLAVLVQLTGVEILPVLAVIPLVVAVALALRAVVPVDIDGLQRGERAVLMHERLLQVAGAIIVVPVLGVLGNGHALVALQLLDTAVKADKIQG